MKIRFTVPTYGVATKARIGKQGQWEAGATFATDPANPPSLLEVHATIRKNGMKKPVAQFTYEIPVRAEYQPEPIPDEFFGPTSEEVAERGGDANATARADYRYGPHETAHSRIASLLEAHDRNTHGPFTHTGPDGTIHETPIQEDASSRYIHSIAQDIVDLHDRGETSSGARGSRNVYSRQTVELAREVASARQSSPAGASTHDYYTLQPYTHTDGTTSHEWHLKPRVGMLLSNIERDHNHSSALQEARADQEKRRAASAARFAGSDW